jgi:glyoxylase-like metal-dependent hydrolase (beta-lactamase superfamily II)
MCEPALEIAPGVHTVPLLGVAVHVIVDEGITLIDAGLPFSEGRLRVGLARHGLALGDVRRVICTHGHPDHAGGARGLERQGVEILMHPSDLMALHVSVAELLRHPTRGKMFAVLTPSPARPSPLSDGQVLPILGGIHVIHTPGHTPGSVCLYAPAHRLLFVGDALEIRRGRVDIASRWYSDDIAAAVGSVRRLAELDVGTIAFSHYPPWTRDAQDELSRLAERAASERAAGGRAHRSR